MTSRSHPIRSLGFSLIELLVVLAIVAILAIVSVTTIGNRPASGVRAVMDEIEGVLVAAHKRTTSAPGDVVLSTSGVWGGVGPAAAATLTFTGANAPGDSFVYAPRSRDYDYAGIACGTTWANSAIASLMTVPPTDAGPFLDALNTPLFTGAANPTASVVNGYNKRFSQGFYVAIVGLRNGNPVTGGPVGVLVVPGGGNSVYKFYRTNSTESWRRL